MVEGQRVVERIALGDRAWCVRLRAAIPRVVHLAAIAAAHLVEFIDVQFNSLIRPVPDGGLAEITSQFMANAKCTDERLAFSVFHLTEMLLNLKKHYYAAYQGENALIKRLITSPAKTTRELKETYGSLPTEDQP